MATVVSDEDPTTPAAVIGHWTHTTVTDTQAYLQVVGPLAENPEIQDAVGKVGSKAVIKQLDSRKLVGGFLKELLPNDDLAATPTGPLSAGVNQVIGVAVRQVMGTAAASNVTGIASFATAINAMWASRTISAVTASASVMSGRIGKGDVVSMDNDAPASLFLGQRLVRCQDTIVKIWRSPHPSATT